MQKHFKSDSIEFKFISGGDANAGNGGNGYSSGPVGNGNTQNLTINPYNKADGSVDYNTGDKFVQKGPTGQWGDQDATHHGSNTGGAVTTNVTATQTNMIWADQTQKISAGNGGDGGDHNKAYGGDVDIDLGHLSCLLLPGQAETGGARRRSFIGRHV